MGNRAIIIVKNSAEPSPVGIYLHWNGGPESVLAFIEAAKRLGARSPADDPNYFRARLVQIIGNFFGGTLSVGVGDPSRMDDGDNGRYYVAGDFEIVERELGGATTVAGLSPKGRKKYEAIVEQCVAQNSKLFAQ